MVSTVSAVNFLGDLNLTVVWDTVSSTNGYETSALQILDEHKLFHVVDVLTTRSNTFDLCFTNDLPTAISHRINGSLSANYAIGGKPCSDQKAVVVDLEFIQTSLTVDLACKSKFYSSCRADYDEINQLSTNSSFFAARWSNPNVIINESYS